MTKLAKKEFEALDEAQQLDALQQIVDMTGTEIDLAGEAALWDLYNQHFPKPEDQTKTLVYPLETIRCKEGGKRRTLLRGEKSIVDVTLAQQLLAEGLVSDKPAKNIVS